MTPAAVVGDRYESTPMSVDAGPGCSGLLLALVDHLLPLQHAVTRNWACQWRRLHVRVLGVHTSCASAAAARRPWTTMRSAFSAIPAGSTYGGREAVAVPRGYFVCDCSHAGMVEARASNARSVPSVVDTILRGALAALDNEGVDGSLRPISN